MANYTYRVVWSDKDNEYVGLCDRFPSLSWLALTPQGALAGIRQIVADVVAGAEPPVVPFRLRTHPKSWDD